MSHGVYGLNGKYRTLLNQSRVFLSGLFLSVCRILDVIMKTQLILCTFNISRFLFTRTTDIGTHRFDFVTKNLFFNYVSLNNHRVWM